MSNLEWSFAMMFVDDAKGADFGADGTDFRCHIHDQLIFVDQTMVTSGTPGCSIQTRYYNKSQANTTRKNRLECSKKSPFTLPLPHPSEEKTRKLAWKMIRNQSTSNRLSCIRPHRRATHALDMYPSISFSLYTSVYVCVCVCVYIYNVISIKMKIFNFPGDVMKNVFYLITHPTKPHTKKEMLFIIHPSLSSFFSLSLSLILYIYIIYIVCPCEKVRNRRWKGQEDEEETSPLDKTPSAGSMGLADRPSEETHTQSHTTRRSTLEPSSSSILC